MSGQDSSLQFERMLKTIVLGLGNPILSDDSVGIRVALALEGRFDPERVTVMGSSLAGLSLLDLLLGYDRSIIIDSIQTKEGKVGEVYRLGAGDFATTRHTVSPHDVNLGTALELGKRLELELPREIAIFAIEVQDVTTFGICSTKMEQIPKVVEMVAREPEGESLE